MPICGGQPPLIDFILLIKQKKYMCFIALVILNELIWSVDECVLFSFFALSQSCFLGRM